MTNIMDIPLRVNITDPEREAARLRVRCITLKRKYREALQG